MRTILSLPDVITPIHAINDYYIFFNCPNFSSWDSHACSKSRYQYAPEFTSPSLGSREDTRGSLQTQLGPWGPWYYLTSFISVWRSLGNLRFQKWWPCWPLGKYDTTDYLGLWKWPKREQEGSFDLSWP